MRIVKSPGGISYDLGEGYDTQGIVGVTTEELHFKGIARALDPYGA
jgi:hypothetical protein